MYVALSGEHFVDVIPWSCVGVTMTGKTSIFGQEAAPSTTYGESLWRQRGLSSSARQPNYLIIDTSPDGCSTSSRHATGVEGGPAYVCTVSTTKHVGQKKSPSQCSTPAILAGHLAFVPPVGLRRGRRGRRPLAERHPLIHWPRRAPTCECCIAPPG